MPLGPGKYDELCALVYQQAGVKDGDGGVAVIVIGGKNGHGFSVQADLVTTLKLAQTLEYMAAEIRRSGVL
jgi:hypothetical protein